MNPTPSADPSCTGSPSPSDDADSPFPPYKTSGSARQCGNARLSGLGRFFLAVWLGCIVGGFSLAVYLSPDARGYGTHRQLGFPGCSLRVVAGIPCPFCGMTTSVSHFVRGEVIASARSNPAGLLLATLCLLQIPWCLVGIVKGKLVGITHPEWLAIGCLSAVLLMSILQWAFKVFF